MHNDVVQSDIHSTDAFGFSEAIFATSHLLGFSYAPRFKNLKRQRLYIFNSRRQADRSTWKILPTGYVDTDRIIQLSFAKTPSALQVLHLASETRRLIEVNY
jgi:TnpA family transposase